MPIEAEKLAVLSTYTDWLQGQIRRPAGGRIPYPYTALTAGKSYQQMIFVWDGYTMSLAFLAGGESDVMRDLLRNYFSFQRESGYIPNAMHEVEGEDIFGVRFHAQPFLAHATALYVEATHDEAFGREAFPHLQRYLDYWFSAQNSPLGLPRWRETYMSGVDNEIAGTLLPPESIVSPDLGALLFNELNAMAYLAGKLGEAAEPFSQRAAAVKDALNRYCYNEEFGAYCCHDLLRGEARVGFGASDIGRYAFLSTPALWVLYAGAATPERAQRMIETYVLSPEHYRSPFGIRSLSRQSEFYNNAVWGNPPRFGDFRRLTNSNWQGPVWMLTNWFAFHGLLNYGYADAAAGLAADLIALQAAAIKKYGYLSENFNAETGEPLYARDYASWNLLTRLLPDYLPGGHVKVDLFPWRHSAAPATRHSSAPGLFQDRCSAHAQLGGDGR
jgi:putative isomerase